jgi:hypothetical protein
LPALRRSDAAPAFGVSVYDLVKDIAQIKTAMLRSHLDNRYLQNNAEKVINVDVIENIDDFLSLKTRRH